jgi:hypothetical protein
VKAKSLFQKNLLCIILVRNHKATAAYVAYGLCRLEKVMQYLKCGAAAEAAADRDVADKAAARVQAAM